MKKFLKPLTVLLYRYLSVRLLVALTLPFSMTDLMNQLPTTSPNIQARPEPTVSIENLTFEPSSGWPVLLKEEEKIEFKLGESLFDKEERERWERERQAKLTRERLGRGVLSRESSERSVEPSFEEKYALVKRAFGSFGIEEYAPLGMAVWETETGLSWDTGRVSRADGRATGPFQFMPGTFRLYKTHPGAKITSATDSAYAAAHLLYKAGLDQGHVDRALYGYNHSKKYVELVKQRSKKYAG